MSKPNLILMGAGGHAHACIDVIEQHGGYHIAGLVGMAEELHHNHMGYRVIGTDSDLSELIKEYKYALVTVGQIQSPANRMRLYRKASEFGFQFPTIIAPSAHVSRHAFIGAGTIVMHGAIINAGARVGDNCIINTRALIEHDTVVEDQCHISTGVILNGNSYIGTGSFIGSGSIVKEGIRLGDCCLVGMGLSVRNHHSDHTRIVTDNKS
jgi:sugar O-acyltransferase (sialic acid O-acetyltransferase NeuD family)